MPVVKGGVWTNIEDEILKASVSKYGLNQWARVSSLLPRKSAKQCKARWSEWLDPSIKKIEWSKEEDEKLLHLAKLMPTQWRTIAPIVGRTANQCLERYQKLLDEAEQREASAFGLTGPEGGETQAPTAEDVRKLRPGEIDPDPETKPAKPDTIDMDEDEKEMLSEARARLANTQGKKAKRKARERQQEESRRLAALQKRRELKTAGINIKVTTRKPGQMDYNADIPFEKAPAPGFYDTNDEQARNEFQRAAFDPKKQQIGSKRKGDEDEDPNSKRRKNDKDGTSAATQAALKAGQAQKIREAERSSKRRALNLPAPQVSEGELEDIVKMGMMGERANLLAQSSENDATRGLVNTYSTLTGQTPIRTPMAPPQEDRVANEIRNIRALTENQSALLGGDNAELFEGASSTGFEGATPRKQVMATPNPMATPLRNGANGVLATPDRVGQTPLRTPRDSFALNAAGEMLPPTGSDAKRHQLAIRNQLRSGLASLPKPKETEWDLELPEDQQEPTTVDDLPEDSELRDRRERMIREAQEALERRRRTQVMQKELPRPERVELSTLLESAAALADPLEAMVAKEAALLIAHDAARYPLVNSAVAAKQVPLQQIDDDALAQARLQILSETRGDIKPAEVEATFNRENSNAILLGLGCYEDDDDEEEIAAMKSALASVQESTMATVEKSAKLEKKLTLHLGGYQQRAKMLRGKMAEAAEALEKARAALSAFRTLSISEEITIRSRREALMEEVTHVTRREREAQEEYRRNREELDALVAQDGVNGYH
ncbi:pre-mRNA splicing factor component-domain-containing protein [Microdochium trichocladiopsis]|uniref:Pre-mRNA splicing factor component-domain-containing protein n=1 Tax=Microdochium trichocladiopsis TaxID=1682393 RepID=A0A9P9BT01_9PEZI|nr:pre-mRNA splicing factor component-domain-containing protein [Microdochium trichocladiopsis]KAH7035400.1 pre-mRNA splicing factor component-domain-containing protein [Microdochium trichocladiopsis]